MAAQAIIERFLGRMVRKGTLSITLHDGTTFDLGTPAPGYPDVAVRLVGKGTARKILMDPRIGAGEAFMDGNLLIERGDIMELIALLRSNRRWEGGGVMVKPSFFNKIKRNIANRIEQRNDAKASTSNVSHHYDIGNDLYRLFLDADHMQYSCGYWPREGMTLDEAQEAKLAHIASKLALAPGQTVLDIGCGWGGMAIYLARHADVKVHGITLSREQIALAKERAEAAGVADRVTFEMVDYRALPERGDTYDRIVSVGMFEHVGRPQFRTFFHAIKSILKPDGVMLLHTIGRMGNPGNTDAFTRKYIFPGGYIPALTEILGASQPRRLIATDVETWRLHYAKTLRAWYANCFANREAIEALYDERFFRMWTFYLAGATAAFEHGTMCNYQVQYAPDRHTLPLSRDYMAEAEQALLNG